MVMKILAATTAEILLVTSVALANDSENQMIEAYYQRMADVAEEEGAALAGVHAYWGKKIAAGLPHSSLVQSDGVHPSVEGYRLMAEAIGNVFV